MLSKNGGVCSICFGPMIRICVDHYHLSGAVRGLLCHPCNVKLHALDKWAHKTSALEYLKPRLAQ